jgi:hypothetical protein
MQPVVFDPDVGVNQPANRHNNIIHTPLPLATYPGRRGMAPDVELIT